MGVRKKFEYLVEKGDLNKLGQDGWEAVGIYPSGYILFKREVIEVDSENFTLEPVKKIVRTEEWFRLPIQVLMYAKTENQVLDYIEGHCKGQLNGRTPTRILERDEVTEARLQVVAFKVEVAHEEI